MLAKQGCRLLDSDNHLVSSLMKARYYPEGGFLSATIGSNPSYMWRSIMVAHDSVRQGYGRRIGNGQSIRVWKVPWLLDIENGCLSIDMPPALEEIMVSGLIKKRSINGMKRYCMTFVMVGM